MRPEDWNPKMLKKIQTFGGGAGDGRSGSTSGNRWRKDCIPEGLIHSTYEWG
jgi:hypothetical protein